MLRKLFPLGEFTRYINPLNPHYFILMLLVLLSCYESEPVQTNSDIEKAKSWFQLNEANLSKSTTNPSARSTRFEKRPDWSKSKVHTSKSGMKSVEVALDYETYLGYSESDTEIRLGKPNVINSMLLFEIEPDHYEVYLFKIYPDDPNTQLSKEDFDRLNYGEIPADFSGRIIVFDWNENFVGGWRVANGEKIRYIGQTRDDPAKANQNAKTDDIIRCYQITIYWYSIACSSSGCGDPILIDQFSYVECEVIIAPPDPSDPGGGGGGGDPDGDCFEPHPFIEGLMVPCESEPEPCPDGLMRDLNGNCYCPSFKEMINGQCLFKCLDGYRRNAAGVCVQIQNCTTNDPLINAIQSMLDDIWRSSNASHTSITMADRTENGGWIVNGPSGYSFIPFPNTWIRTPCGVDLPANWANDIPTGLVGWVHSHPFYVGEDTRGVCGASEGEVSYKGGPSKYDAEFLYRVIKQTNNIGLKGYVIDGHNIHTFNWQTYATGQYTTTTRCGY